MSFHRVKIVTSITEKPKIKLKIKRLEKSLSETLCINSQNETAINSIYNNPCIKKSEPSNLNSIVELNTPNNHISTIPVDNIIGNHYIGLIFMFSVSVNKLHNIQYKQADDVVYLNITSLYLKDNKYFPIFKLDDSLINTDFKYKKYIRNILYERYNINKNDIYSIKLCETYGNLHNYIIVLNNNKCLNNGINSIHSKSPNLYSWRSLFDSLCHKETDLFIPLNKIYKYIQQTNFTPKPTITLHPHMDNAVPNYIINYVLVYDAIVNIMTCID